MLDEAGLLQLLDAKGIEYRRINHPAVFTVEQADLYTANSAGSGTKNLFLCDDKKTQYLLVSIRSDKRANLKVLGDQLGLRKLRFASEAMLMDLLGLAAGSVTILGLLNDKQGRVQFYLDKDLVSSAEIQCHPMVNTATLILNTSDLISLMTEYAHAPTLIDIFDEPLPNRA